MKTLLQLILLLSLSSVLITCTSKYKVTALHQTESTVTMTLAYTGQDEYYIKPTSPIIKDLNFTFHAHALNDFYFKIQSLKTNRFQVPQEQPFPVDPLRNLSFPIQFASFKFDFTIDPFDFTITRKANNATLFTTSAGQIIFSQYYLQISTKLDSVYTYGLGQRFNPGFRLKQGKWTIFNRDRGNTIDNGNGFQTYGYYPVYLQRQKNNSLWHVNYFRSSNAMDVILKQQADETHTLTYKVIGGIFDFRFFINQNNPMLVVEKFHQYLGRSAIPPFWSLGFHQCRWGYQNVAFLQNVIKGYQSNNLPLDTIWTDIDYMIDYEDFTIDENRFPINRMKNITNHYHWVPIIDAGIKIGGASYLDGVSKDVYIKQPFGRQLRGRVWPGATVFVDFFHPNASLFWTEWLDVLYKKIAFSGVWLDMNQLANFCDGPCQVPVNKSFDFSKDLPYNPGNDSIESHTIPLNSTHFENRTEADVHAFTGFLQTFTTYLFLKSKNIRPFVLSRSSTLGTNKFGFHWTGDNYANFDFLKSSITDNFINNMWGVTMVGADICGFGGNTTEQLCSRWMQLGSLYTFARNHNDLQSKSQQPYALGDVVLKASHANLHLRYSLLKHYFSLFINRKGIGTIFNPLFFVFPTDQNSYLDDIAQTHFLIGNNLLAVPILQANTTTRKAYFPNSSWYNFHTGEEYAPGVYQIKNVELTDKVPLFLRQGSLVFTQDTTSVRNTRDLGNKFTLVAGFHLDQRRSNATHQIYTALGSHISLQDYTNDVKIDQCLQTTCEYTFDLILTTTIIEKSLTINVAYAGGPSNNGLLVINKFTIYFGGHAITRDISPPLDVKGPQRRIIPIIGEQQPSKNLRPQEE